MTHINILPSTALVDELEQLRRDDLILEHAGQYLTGETDEAPPGFPALSDPPMRPPPCGPRCGGKRKCAQCRSRG